MTLHEFLRSIHFAYRPRSYLEIGVNTGRSLALSRVPTIAVDPAFRITHEVRCDLQLVQATSDDFFARDDALGHLPDRKVDLAFIDGLHLFEFVLRDFMNIERQAKWTSVIVIDDVLPRGVAETSRERGGMKIWTGDVFKVVEVLATYRPDLLLVPVDTEPTGVLVILGADADSTVLAENYDSIVGQHVSPDPQTVPEAVLRRENAVEPYSIANSNVWAELARVRDSGLPREVGWDNIRRSVEMAARPAAVRPIPGPASAAEAGPSVTRSPGYAPQRRLVPVRRRLGRFRRAFRRRRKAKQKQAHS